MTDQAFKLEKKQLEQNQQTTGQKDPPLLDSSQDAPRVLDIAPGENYSNPEPSVHQEPQTGPTFVDEPSAPAPRREELHNKAPGGPPPSVKTPSRKKKSSGFAFTLLILSVIGLLAFVAGGLLAVSVISGTFDIQSGWLKETVTAVKELIKNGRHH